MSTISPTRLHELWKTIDNTPASAIAELGDADLVDWLTEQFDRERSVPTKELNVLRKYLESRLQLIRDLTMG